MQEFVVKYKNSALFVKSMKLGKVIDKIIRVIYTEDAAFENSIWPPCSKMAAVIRRFINIYVAPVYKRI